MLSGGLFLYINRLPRRAGQIVEHCQQCVTGDGLGRVYAADFYEIPSKACMFTEIQIRDLSRVIACCACPVQLLVVCLPGIYPFTPLWVRFPALRAARFSFVLVGAEFQFSTAAAE